MRMGDYKCVFAEQRMPGTMAVWAEPFTKLRIDQALQPDAGPLRAGRHHLQHLLGLEPQPRAADVQGMEDVTNVRRDVQGVPAALRPAELQPGQHAGRHPA